MMAVALDMHWISYMEVGMQSKNYFKKLYLRPIMGGEIRGNLIQEFHWSWPCTITCLSMPLVSGLNRLEWIVELSGQGVLGG